MEHAIVLKPEILGHLGFLPITNTMLVSWIVMIVIIAISFLATRKMKLVPSGLQNLMEMTLEYFYNTVEEMSHSAAKAKVFFPIVMTFFLYILVANWLGLFPGFMTVGFDLEDHGHHVWVPLFRSLNSDLNMTLGLGILSIVITHIFSVKYLGLKGYLARWVSKNPILLFVGFLEIISEFTKIVSLSFRLFGNIFAGEVVLGTVATLAPWTAFLVPLPFYLLEVIVGIVQALVFMMLTLVFLVLLTEKHEEAH